MGKSNTPRPAAPFSLSDRAVWIPIRKIRCPRCGLEPIGLKEVWESHAIDFEVSGGCRASEGWMEEGKPACVFAECGCGHKWRVRRADQIIDLDVSEGGA
jgi:hypothetical protein